MLSLFQPWGNEWPVDTAYPVNVRHRLAVGRVGWWLALPGNAGNRTWYDLMSLAPATLATTVVNFVSTARPGSVAYQAVNVGASAVGTDFVSVGNLPQLGPTAGLTVAAWARWDVSRNNCPVVAKWGAGASYLLLVDSSADKMNFTVKIGGSNRTVISSATYLGTGWHRFVGTYDGATVSLYVDGLSVGTPVSVTGSIATGADAVVFGNYSSSGNNFTSFVGSFDDVVIANRGWSADEVREDYEESRAGYPGLLNRRGPAGALRGASAGVGAPNLPLLGVG